MAWASLAATREVSPVPCTAGRREGRNQGEPRLSPPWVGLQSDVRPLGGVRLRPGTAEGSASAEAGGGEAHVAAHREDTGAVGSVSVEARRAGERRCIRLIYDTRMKAGPSGGRGGSTRVSFHSPGGCAKPVSTHDSGKAARSLDAGEFEEEKRTTRVRLVSVFGAWCSASSVASDPPTWLRLEVERR